jgi:PTS system mannose-specific IIA component
MTVGLLIVTHNHIGEELITTATSIHGDQSLAMHSISIPSSLEPAALGGYADEIRNAIVDFKSEHGVLILTDVYGATPHNLASYFATDLNVEIVSGVNLPMLLRILNYSQQTLDQIAVTATEGANKGIILGL